MSFFHDDIRAVSGHFWHELEPVNRKTVLERLNRLTKNIRSVKDQLSPLRGGFQESAEADTEVVNLLVRAVRLAHAGQHPRPREQLEISLKVVDVLEDTCERALVLLSELPARRGQPRLAWYDELVSLMLRVADLIGINKVSTAGDRSEDPYATPFTVLVFEAERVLHEEAWSPPGGLRQADRPEPEAAERARTTEFAQNRMNSVV